MLYALLSNIVWTESDCLAGMVDGGGQYVKMTHETVSIVHLLVILGRAPTH